MGSVDGKEMVWKVKRTQKGEQGYRQRWRTGLMQGDIWHLRFSCQEQPITID